MKPRSFLALLGAAAIAVSAAFASGDQAEAGLFPPVPAPDPDATGQVRVEKDGAEQGFRVRAERVSAASPPGPFEVWLETGVGTGSFFSVGAMSLEAPGLGRWELNLQAVGGAPAPLGVPDLDDVAGRKVQVRDVGGLSLYLQGIVPLIGAGGGGTGPTTQGEIALQRPEAAPDPDAFGQVELAKRGGEQEFGVDCRNLPAGPGDSFGVYLENAVGSGTFFLVAGMVLDNAPQGRWGLALEAAGAAPAQLGVADLGDLQGRKVEIRDASGAIYLWAVLPGLAQGQGQGNFNGRGILSTPNPAPSPDGSGFVRIRFNAPHGRSTFEVRTRRLLPGATYSVWIEGASGSGTFAFAGDLSNGRLKRDTKRGEPIPLGAATVAALSGRAIHIRDGAGAVHLQGTIATVP